MYNRVKAIEGDSLLWGDEVEYAVLSLDETESTARLSLRGAEILAELKAREDQAADVLSRLDGLSRPVIIIHGDDDDWVPFSNAEDFMARLPAASEAELIAVPGGGHFLNMDEPALLLEVIQQAIARAEARDDDCAAPWRG